MAGRPARKPKSAAQPPKPVGRTNQRLRTRRELLSAAARWMKQHNGRTPSMDDVAAEAMVSRATAYRYFPTIESLLIEAPLDGQTPDPRVIFADDCTTDPVARIDKAEAALHDMVVRNLPHLRRMLAVSLLRDPAESKNVPLRQNRRSQLIDAALAPARRQFTPATYRKLTAALALIFGTESMIVFTDVLGLDVATARKIKSWTIQTLVRAALADSTRDQAGQ